MRYLVIAVVIVSGALLAVWLADPDTDLHIHRGSIHESVAQ